MENDTCVFEHDNSIIGRYGYRYRYRYRYSLSNARGCRIFNSK